MWWFRNHHLLAKDPYAPLCLYDLLGIVVRLVPYLYSDVPFWDLLQFLVATILFLFLELPFRLYQRPFGFAKTLALAFVRFAFAQGTYLIGRAIFHDEVMTPFVLQRIPSRLYTLSQCSTHTGVQGWWLRMKPNSAYTDPPITLFYIHGGGFCMCTSSFALQWLSVVLRRVSERLKRPVQVFSMDYGWAPEQQYPEQLGQVIAAYHYLLKERIRPQDIVVMGGSAGANLALSFLLHSAVPCEGFEAVRGPPKGYVLQSPWWDLEMRADKVHSFKQVQHDYLDLSSMHDYAAVYMGASKVPPQQTSPLVYMERLWQKVLNFFAMRQRPPAKEDLPRKYSDTFANPVVHHRSRGLWQKALQQSKLTILSGDDEVLHASIAQQVDMLRDLQFPIEHHVIAGGVHESTLVDFYLGRDREERRRGVEVTAALIARHFQ